MGLNFHKTIKIAPGVNLNIGKTGVGVSVGTRGARFSVNSKGQTRQTFSIPGTGISYTSTSSVKKTIEKLTGTGETRKSTSKSASTRKAGTKTAAVKEVHPTPEEQEYAAANAEQIQALKEIHKFHLDPVDWQKIANTPQAAGQSFAAWQKMNTLAQGILANNYDTMTDAVEELKIFDEIAKYGSGFEMGMREDGIAAVEFDIAAENVMPTTVVSITASGKLSEKAMSKSAYFDLEQDYVCSTVLRIAADLFALLPVDQVLIHAKEQQLNSATGNEEEICILSSLIERRQFEKINLDKVDPSDCLESFDTRMKFLKTKGFVPVEPIE
jgi:hypothetical protein